MEGRDRASSWPRLRRHLKRGAAAVFAEVAGYAEEVAFAVEDHSIKWLQPAAGLAKIVKHTVFPCTAWLGRQLEDDAAAISRTTVRAAGGSAIEISHRIPRQSAISHATEKTVREVVEDGFLPVAAAAGELEDCTVVVWLCRPPSHVEP